MTMAERRRAALATIMPGFTGDTVPPWLARLLREGLGSVCLFAGNITSAPGVRRLTDQLRRASPDVVITIDEEGGDVTRLWHHAGGSHQPGNAVLGRLDDPALTRAAAAALARELRGAGVTMTLGPVADINSDPDNPVIATRSFGTEPQAVARHVRAWVEGLQAGGVAACAKHFPGHGDTSIDSHRAMPVIDRSPAELTDRELVPFAAAIGADVAAVMTSHILLPRLDRDGPATMSAPILTGLLRSQMAHSGLIITDALDMAGAGGAQGMAPAAVGALRAGADLLCLGTDNTPAQVEEIVAAVLTAVEDGTLPESRLREAAERGRRLARAHPPGADPPAASSAAVATPEQLTAAFALSDRARALLVHRWTPVVVRLESEANIAVGPGDWGPFRQAAGAGLAVRTVAQALAEPPQADQLVVVVGRDNHRRPAARRAIEALRERHRATLVVDMGWPKPAAGLVDLATYGAGPAVSAALLELLNTGERG